VGHETGNPEFPWPAAIRCPRPKPAQQFPSRTQVPAPPSARAAGNSRMLPCSWCRWETCGLRSESSRRSLPAQFPAWPRPCPHAEKRRSPPRNDPHHASRLSRPVATWMPRTTSMRDSRPPAALRISARGASPAAIIYDEKGPARQNPGSTVITSNQVTCAKMRFQLFRTGVFPGFDGNPSATTRKARMGGQEVPATSGPPPASLLPTWNVYSRPNLGKKGAPRKWFGAESIIKGHVRAVPSRTLHGLLSQNAPPGPQKILSTRWAVHYSEMQPGSGAGPGLPPRARCRESGPNRRRGRMGRGD